MTIPQKILDELDRAPDKVGGKPWEPWEDEVIRKYRKSKGYKQIAKVLNRTYSSVKNRSERL